MTLARLPDLENADVEQWVADRDQGMRLLLAVLFGFFAVFWTFIFLAEILPQVASLPSGVMGVVLFAVFAAVEILFVGGAGVAFFKWFGSAYRLGVAPGSIVIERPLRKARLRLADLTAFETDYSLLVGASIALYSQGHPPVKVLGMQAMTVEGLASHIQVSLPHLADPIGWGSTKVSDGSLRVDPTWVQGFGGKRAPPPGRWATPTRAARLQIESIYAAVLSMNLLLLVWAPTMASNLDMAIALPVVSSSGLAGLGLYVGLFMKARHGSPPHAGYSTLELAGHTDPSRVSAAVDAGLRSLGLPVPAPTTRNLLLVRRTVWALPGVLRLRSTVHEGNVRRLDLTTFGPPRIETHRALKGFLLDALSSPAHGGARPAPSAPLTERWALNAAPWDAAVMADGRLVPDGGTPFGSAAEATGESGVWSSFSARAMQFMGILVVPVLLVFVWFFGMMAVDGLRLGPPGTWGVWAVVMALGAPTVVFTYPMMRGQYWYSLLRPPGAWNDIQAVDRLVTLATAAVGRRVVSKKQGLMGVKWKLDAPLWFRYVAVGAPGSGMLQLYVNWRPNLALYARLKGCVIESLGTAPIGGPLPTARLQDALPPAPSAPLEDWEPLSRGQPGARLSRPPPWAMSAQPDGGSPLVDIALGAGGIDKLPAGWWGSRDPAGDSRRTNRFVLFVAIVPGVAILGLIMAISVAQAPSGSNPVVVLVAIATLAAGTALFAGLMFFSFRRFRKEAVRTQAHSFLRLEVPVERLGSVLARLDPAIRVRIPEAQTVLPPVGGTARWEDLASSIVITLWLGQGSLPLLELASNRDAAAVARLKGIIEAALFAPGASP
ncbi:MAG TPA: hypothetical protein VJ547_12820 [Candidatus Thermoplasmatota archaeon]|nr:hypothetical protein [Candidatus Thermoplasmatota archaeon]